MGEIKNKNQTCVNSRLRFTVVRSHQ